MKTVDSRQSTVDSLTALMRVVMPAVTRVAMPAVTRVGMPAVSRVVMPVGMPAVSRVVMPVMLVVIAAVLFFAPDALACSVCFDSKEERRAAFMITTILLTVLPLALVFGTIYWLRKIANKNDTHTIPPAE